MSAESNSLEVVVSESKPISWRSIVYGTPVVSSDNASIGKVREVLGSDADDIFHGLRVGLAGERRDVMVGADDISSLASDSIGTDLTSAEIHALPTYSEAATFHLASVGWLRKHIDWKEDSRSDEEPG